MITSFDRTNLRLLRTDLAAALAEVEAKHGIKFTIGNMRFGPNDVRMKLEAATETSDTVTNTGSADLDRLSTMHNLPDNLLGRKVRFGKQVLTIVGAKLSRPKYPFAVEGVQGGKYKMSVDQIREGLITT